METEDFRSLTSLAEDISTSYRSDREERVRHILSEVHPWLLTVNRCKNILVRDVKYILPCADSRECCLRITKKEYLSQR